MLRNLVLIFVFLLAGCATVKNEHYIAHRQTEYLTSVETAPLQFPQGYDRSKINDKYQIPPLTGNRPTRPVSIIPPGSSLEKIPHK